LLAALLIVLFAAIIGGALVHPGNWHDKFKVGLGLDLSSGTTVTIKTVVLTPGQPAPTSGQLTQSIAILNSRINGQGFTGAKVQREGSNLIIVSVPHRSAENIAPLLRSAVLRFRQVLLLAPGTPTPLPPAPAANASPLPSPPPSTAPSPSPSQSSAASPKSSPSASSSASRSSSAGSGQAAASRALSGSGRSGAKASASASPTPSPSSSAAASPSVSPTTSPSASPSPSPSPSLTKRLATVADAQGNPALVKRPAVIADFNRLNCAHKDWQKEIYGGNPTRWDNATAQVVACDGQGYKYVLDVAKVQGTNLTKVAAQLNQQGA